MTTYDNIITIMLLYLWNSYKKYRRLIYKVLDRFKWGIINGKNW